MPGSGGQTRSYSFSSLPGSDTPSFLIKRVPGGLMGGYLDSASPGQVLELTQPAGQPACARWARPVLMLAGGTGLARRSCRCWPSSRRPAARIRCI